MNDEQYFAYFMLTKINCKIIKEQQKIYIELIQFLNKCNGEYCFYENYLIELRSLYTNNHYKSSLNTQNRMNIKVINLLLSNLDDLRYTNNVKEYVDDCFIMEIDDLDLLCNLGKFFEELI
jgi:hypothetical protein